MCWRTMQWLHEKCKNWKKKLLLFPVLVKFAGDLQKQHVWTYKSRKVGHGDLIFDIEVKVTYI